MSRCFNSRVRDRLCWYLGALRFLWHRTCLDVRLLAYKLYFKFATWLLWKINEVRVLGEMAGSITTLDLATWPWNNDLALKWWHGLEMETWPWYGDLALKHLGDFLCGDLALKHLGDFLCGDLDWRMKLMSRTTSNRRIGLAIFNDVEGLPFFSLFWRLGLILWQFAL